MNAENLVQNFLNAVGERECDLSGNISFLGLFETRSHLARQEAHQDCQCCPNQSTSLENMNLQQVNHHSLTFYRLAFVSLCRYLSLLSGPNRRVESKQQRHHNAIKLFSP